MLILKVKEKHGYRNIIINNIKGVTNVYRKTYEYPQENRADLEDPASIYGRYVKLFIGDIEITKVFVEFNRENAMDILRKTEARMDDIVDVITKCICSKSLSGNYNFDFTSQVKGSDITYKGSIIEDTAFSCNDIILTIERDQITHINYGNLRQVLNKKDIETLVDNQNKL